MRIVWCILLLAMAALVAGCAASGPAATPTAPPASPTALTTTSTPTASASSSASVMIKDFSFQPDVVTIAREGTVTWTNDDSTTHTVKFADGESPALQKGGTYDKKFAVAGTYDYSCGIHPGMHGTVKVV